MAEETSGQPQTTTGPEGQQVQVMLVEQDVKIVYANAYRIHPAAEEVIVDLGFNMPNPNPQQPNSMVLKVTDRVVLSYVNVKRLAVSLSQLVKRYESQFGEINMMGPARK